MMFRLPSIVGRFWFGSIRRQLMLAFALSTALLMFAFGYSIVAHERDFLMRQSLGHAKDLAHTVAVSSTSWVIANDVAGLQEVLQSVARNPNLKYAFVLSPSGRVVASTHAGDIGRFVRDSVSRHLFLSSSDKLTVLVDSPQQADVAAPVLANHRVVGWVRIGWARADVRDNLRAVVRQGYEVAGIALVITLLVAMAISRGLTSRLHRLIEAANLIESGRRDVRADVARSDEVGLLAGTLNRMLDALVGSERELARLNRLYAAWTESSEVIVRETDEQALLDRICVILAGRVPFKLVWVGVTDADGWVQAVAASDPDSGYLNQHIRISTDPSRPEGSAPIGVAIREGIPQMHNDFSNEATVPWKAAVVAEDFNSVGAFPLKRGGRYIGALGVYSTELNFFNRDVELLLHGLASDISFALDGFDRERKRREAEAQVVLAAKVFDNSKEGILVTDAENRIISVNRGFTEITDYSAHEVIGQNPRILASGRQDGEFFRAMWNALETAGSWQGEVWNRRKDGEIYPEWLTITCIRNEAGQVTNYVGVFSDISERKLAEARIQHLAHFDALTDLPNRTLLRDRLEQAIIKAQRSQDKVAVMFLDLDRFKHINDTLGHGVGDVLLKVVSERLLCCVREQDTVSRQGGDEFLIILPDTAVDGAVLVAQKILTALAVPCLIEGHDLRITPSIGISLYPDDAKDMDTLIKLADVAMYHAKDSGRNNYQFYTESMNASAYERLTLENGLRSALERDEFMLYYQPQVNIATGKISGCEALIRWNHPEFGMVSPASFIPLAEECGLIVPIGEWVVREACRQMRAWQLAIEPSLIVAVNLSALQFRRPGLTEMVMHALSDAGMMATSLELELTEGILMQGVDSTLATLQKMAAIGLQLSIDDFGTGYSSLSYLKRFPIHKLKIDQSFVRELATDANDAAIVRTIILMAHSLNLSVIAEGVETAEQLDFLRKSDCDEMQGYYYSRPLPADEFEALLRSGKALGTG